MNKSSITYQSFAGSAEAWNCLVTASEGSSFLQTWEFGEAKTEIGPWNVERGVLLDGGSYIGAAQSMVRKPPFSRAGVVWINRAPIGVFGNYGDALGALHHYFCNERKMYLRIAPSRILENLSSFEYNNSGLKKTKISGWASSIVNLQQTEELLRNNLHGKWRNALSRAERSNIEICISDDKESFQIFLKGHSEHLDKRSKHRGLQVGFLEALQDMLPKDRKLLCVAAYKNGDYLGGALVTRYGQVAEYFAGHNTDIGRPLNAGQLILWSVIMHLKALGMSKFDLGGMDENLSPPGIYRFKNRIGGEPYRLAYEMEGLTTGLMNRIIRWCVNSQRRMDND